MIRRSFCLLMSGMPLAAQVAGNANDRYRSEQGREGIAKTLLAHDREQTQRPGDIVQAMHLAAGASVADVGTGAGFMLPYLAAAVGPTGHVVAEDIFPDFLAKAQARAKEKELRNVEFIHGSERDPKLPAGRLDAVLVLDVYHHFDYPADMLSGLAKGLKQDGRLFIVDFYKDGFRDPNHIRLDQVDVAKEIESNGFRLVATRPLVEGRQYIAEFRKK